MQKPFLKKPQEVIPITPKITTVKIPVTTIHLPIVTTSKKAPSVKKIKPQIKFSYGYKTLVKRRGKWFELGGISPRAKAIQKGQEYSLKTLGRSFKIVPTKKQLAVPKPYKEYKPSIKFRSYKIKKKKKIPLKDEWIQRVKYALSTFGEKREIKAARKSKARRIKWF